MALFTFTISFLAMLSVTAGLSVGPIQLASNNSYISYKNGNSGNNSILVCPYTLLTNERVQSVSWIMWDDNNILGTYTWSPTSPETVGGVLMGVVNMSRSDANLQLTQLTYNLTGDYSCTVTLTTGQNASSQQWEVLIIDKTDDSISTIESYNQSQCSFNTSVNFFAVFPEPTVQAGLYSEGIEGYVSKVSKTQWVRTVYQNKSVSYSYSGVVFKIDQNVPYDAVFLVSVGVTKSDGTYISLASVESINPSWDNIPGCTPLYDVPNQEEVYETGKLACRNEYIPDPDIPKAGFEKNLPSMGQ
nr:uncharacterized protein LOC128690156 [Cherax quadricarinatus]